MVRKTLLISLLTLLSVATKAAYVPVPVTGYNADVVANGAGPSATSAPQDVDGAGYAFMAPDFNPSGTTFPTSFLPATGLVTSAVTTTPGLTYQMASYSAPNSLRLSGTTSGTLTFTTPIAAGEVYVMATGGSGACTVGMTVTFTDATTQVFASQAVGDWYGGANFAILGLGRVNKATDAIDNNTSNPRLYQVKLALLPTNYTKQIASISFANTGAVLNVMGVSIATVCSGAVTAGVVASSAGTSACSGVNFNLSLPTATSGVGITYQWQSSTTGGAPWTTIAAATSATYTANQTVPTTYRAFITCNNTTADTSNSITVTIKPASQCYCVPSASSNLYYINSFITTGATTNVSNTGTGTSVTSAGYSDYSGTHTISAMQGTVVNFTSAYTGSTFGTKIYVDWNQNGLFTDAGETMFGTSAYANNASGSFTVPVNAIAGATKLRIRIDYVNSAGPAPCGALTGSEAEDYTFNVIPLPNCTGTPVPGITTSTMDFICPTETAVLSYSGPNWTGQTTQWQSSPDGLVWTDIAGATNATYSITGQTALTYYRNKQVCTLTSSPIAYSTVDTIGSRACYCSPSFTNGCSTWRLTNVTFGTINNSPTACATSNYLALSTTVMAGVPFPMSITTNQFAAATVYIDLNNDGDFNDVNELLYQEPYSGNATSTVNPNITIPSTTPGGNYRFRVICKWGGAAGVGEACTAFPSASYGNFHDYTLKVLTAVVCTAPTAQPTALTLTPSATQVAVAFTAASPAADRYLIVRTTGGPLVTMPVNGVDYVAGNTLGTGTVISNNASLSLTDAGLVPGTNYHYTIFANNNICIGGTKYNTTAPLSGMVYTPVAGVYSWNGSVSSNWNTPANWTPARTIVDPSDILQFNNGLIDTATNIPTQTIRRLVVNTNTTAYLQASATATLTISDTVAATNDLEVANGSSLISNGTAALTIAFSGTNNKTMIAGNLESVSGTNVNVFNFANTTATVAATGSIIGSGTTGTSCFGNTTVTNLLVSGTYKHNYTTSSGPQVPIATWNTGSTVLIAGYTTATGGPNGGLNQVFYDVTYNCPLQTSNTNWSGTGPLTVTNNLTVTSTGTGSWQISNTQGYQYVIKNFVQTGGTLNMNSGVATGTPTLNVSGNFNQTGGTFTSTGNSTGNSAPTINFNGNTAQNVNFFNAAPVGPIVYRISNPAGINLTGTGTLTSAFNINNNGGVRITTTGANPITTSLALTYAATNTTLYYDTAGSYTMTAAAFPATNGPQNLNIATGNSNNVITMPFSRTVPGTLTMASGDINLTTNTLTIGTTAAAPGTLSYTSGNIRVTTGSLVRWFGTTGLPTAAGTGVGFYPLAFGGANRNVAISFDAATALSTGGTIALGHTNANGLATVSVADGAYTIERRTNAFWNVNATGLVLSGTNKIRMQLTGTGLYTATNPTNLRVLQAAAVAGGHVNGTGLTALRNGLVVADLANMNYYVGAALVDIGGIYIAINNGAWGVGSTWDIGTPPTSANDAYINTGVVVTANATTNAAKSLYILPGGTLTINSSNTVTIDSAIFNGGTLNVSGGTLVVNGSTGAVGITNAAGSVFNLSSGTATVGPVGGGNKLFATAGILNVTGGTLNINGNMITSAGSTFNQSGGNVNVDGNAGSNAANSVASGVTIVSFQSQLLNLTGGNFTIVDPHPNATSTRTFDYNTAAGSVGLGLGHNFVFGNGVSTDTTANATNGYRINQAFSTSRMSFGNLIINGALGTNRFVSPGNALFVLGNMTINDGGEYRTAASQLYINGNLTVNTGGKLTSDATVNFTNLNATTSTQTTINTIAGSVPQTVSGAGLFRNSTSATPTANFAGLTVRNSGNVTFNIGSVVAFSGTVTFAAGLNGPSLIVLPVNGALYEIAGAGQSGAAANAGWVVGRYQKAAGTGAMNHNYPVGDLLNYSPVNVSGTVLTAGAAWASASAGDHPNIATSTINPLASVNRSFTVDTLNGITFTAGSMSATLNWQPADMDPGVNSSAFIIGKYKNAAWTYPTVNSPTNTNIKAIGLTGDVVGQYAVGEVCAPAVIVTNPINTTACVGSSVSLKVSATPKSGLSYQWRKGTTNIPGATDSIFTIPVVVAGDAGSYSVVVSSGCASQPAVTSTAATLTINTPATITTQPAASIAVCDGSPATFTVAATGTGITYQWRKNGIVIPGATSSSYSIAAASTSDAANYTVDVLGVSPCGAVTSALSVLTIKTLPTTITAATTTSFCPGGSVVLNAPATAPANTLTYVWRQNGTAITPAQTGQSYTATTGGSYTAIITNTANGCSDTSNAIVVNVNGAPMATISPAGTASFCAGQGVVLHGLNTPGLTYEWLYNGNPIPGAIDSVHTATLAGNYTLKVSIGSGCSTTSAITAVSAIPLPVVTTTPTGNQALCVNDTLQLTAFYTGSTPVWKFNGSAIVPAATGATYKAVSAGSYTVTVTSLTTGCSNTSAPVDIILNALPAISITSVNAATFCAGGRDTLKANPTNGLTYVWNVGGTPITPSATDSMFIATQSGSYTVTATNANGCKRTSAAVVVTASPLPSVAITSSLPLSMCTGQTNNLCIPAAAGQTYQWSDASGIIAGATSNCLAVTAPGSYFVKAMATATGCEATSVTSAIVVNPTPIATITNTTVPVACAGDTICLNANTGAGLTYQWRHNSNNIPGATSATYCATNSGNYTVVVSNGSNCSATSSIVTMTFNPRPTATISYTTPVTFCEGGAVVLTGVSNTGTTYQWHNNGSAISGATNNSFIAAATGSYSVTITAPNGCASNSATILVVVNPTPSPVITRTNNILSTGNYTQYQWYHNSAPITGGTTQSINVTQNGGYAVYVTDVNGCTNYSSVFMINNVGVKSTLLSPSSIKVFPNPVYTFVNVEAPDKVNVALRDLTGRLIMTVNDAKQIDMSQLPDGFYMLMISDKQGTLVKTEKVTKVTK